MMHASTLCRRELALLEGNVLLGVMWWTALGYLLVSGPEHNVPAGVVYYLGFIGGEIYACWRSSADAFHQGSFKLSRRARGET